MGQDSIQLVVFDLGGVLVRIARSWAEAFQRAGIPEMAAAFEANKEVLAAILDLNSLFELGKINEAQMIDRVRAVVEPCSRAQVCDLLDAWLIEPYAGIEGLFESISAAGLTTACLSNTNERHWRMVMHQDSRYLPLRRLEYRIASHLTGVAKPNAGVYEAVEHQTGVLGGGIVFFDDDHANCQAASDRGWNAHRIDHEADTAAQMAEHLGELGVW